MRCASWTLQSSILISEFGRRFSGLVGSVCTAPWAGLGIWIRSAISPILYEGNAVESVDKLRLSLCVVYMITLL